MPRHTGGINHKAGLPAVEVVFTILHAGGKFGGGGYKVSGGLHGVGASVVNALSEWLEVEIYHEGQIYKQRYERGKVCYKLKVIGNASRKGPGQKSHSFRIKRFLRKRYLIILSSNRDSVRWHFSPKV